MFVFNRHGAERLRLRLVALMVVSAWGLLLRLLKFLSLLTIFATKFLDIIRSAMDIALPDTSLDEVKGKLTNSSSDV